MAKKMDSISTKNTQKIEQRINDPSDEKDINKLPQPTNEKQETKGNAEKDDAITNAQNKNTQNNLTENQNTETDTPNPENENQDSYESLFPEPSVVIGPAPNWIWWAVLIVITIIISAIGFKILDKKLDQWLGTEINTSSSPRLSDNQTLATPTNQTSITPNPEPTIPATPEPTQSVAPIDKSKISIRILNGTTVSGAANKLKSKLEQEGYTIRSVGNANRSNYTETIIYHQEGREKEATQVQLSLNDANSKIEQSTLANPDNILIIYGAK